MLTFLVLLEFFPCISHNVYVVKLKNMTINEENLALHLSFKEYGANVKKWMRKCALLLPKIKKTGVWRDMGFSSIFEYAAKLAGMSKYQVETALWVVSKIEDKPKIMAIVAERGLNIVRPVANLVTKETEEFWSKKIQAMSKGTLEKYAKAYRKGTVVSGYADGENFDCETNLDGKLSNNKNSCADAENCRCEKNLIDTNSVELNIQLPTELVDKLMTLKGNGDWKDLIEKMMETYKKKLETEKPDAVEAKSRHIPNKIRAYVLNKAHHKCVFPGCFSKYAILHHVERFALKRMHDPDTIVPLCTAHERLAHLGLIVNESDVPQNWRLLDEALAYLPKFEVDSKVNLFRQFASVKGG